MPEQDDFTMAFLGDCLVTTATTVIFSIDNGGVEASSIPLPKGSWFAHAFVMMDYLVDEHNLQVGAAHEITLALPSPFLGNSTLSWTGALTTTIAQEIRTCIGFGSDLAADSSGFLSMGPPDPALFSPRILKDYQRSSIHHGGSVKYSNDGTVYSILGQFQEQRQVSIFLDRQLDSFTQYNEWLQLWEERWRVGRAVTFYPATVDISIDQSTVGSGDVLKAPELPVLDFDRISREQDNLFIFSSPDYTFQLRNPVPLTAGFDQAIYIPS